MALNITPENIASIRERIAAYKANLKELHVIRDFLYAQEDETMQRIYGIQRQLAAVNAALADAGVSLEEVEVDAPE